jgi:hypothetical protein
MANGGVQLFVLYSLLATRHSPIARKLEKMSDDREIFPDVSDILTCKAEGRREIARRSLGEKIAMMEALRERLEPFKRAREARQAKRKKSGE